MMMPTETTNMIIRLREEGWDADKILDFLLYAETHTATEEEAIRSAQDSRIDYAREPYRNEGDFYREREQPPYRNEDYARRPDFRMANGGQAASQWGA